MQGKASREAQRCSARQSKKNAPAYKWAEMQFLSCGRKQETVGKETSRLSAPEETVRPQVSAQHGNKQCRAEQEESASIQGRLQPSRNETEPTELRSLGPVVAQRGRAAD